MKGKGRGNWKDNWIHLCWHLEGLNASGNTEQEGGNGKGNWKVIE